MAEDEGAVPEPSLRTKRSQCTRSPAEIRAFFLVPLWERRPFELASAGKETGGGRPLGAGSWRVCLCFSVAMMDGVRS